jgi:hypothetical protein
LNQLLDILFPPPSTGRKPTGVPPPYIGSVPRPSTEDVNDVLHLIENSFQNTSSPAILDAEFNLVEERFSPSWYMDPVHPTSQEHEPLRRIFVKVTSRLLRWIRNTVDGAPSRNPSQLPLHVQRWVELSVRVSLKTLEKCIGFCPGKQVVLLVQSAIDAFSKTHLEVTDGPRFRFCFQPDDRLSFGSSSSSSSARATAWKGGHAEEEEEEKGKTEEEEEEMMRWNPEEIVYQLDRWRGGGGVEDDDFQKNDMSGETRVRKGRWLLWKLGLLFQLGRSVFHCQYYLHFIFLQHTLFSLSRYVNDRIGDCVRAQDCPPCLFRRDLAHLFKLIGGRLIFTGIVFLEGGASEAHVTFQEALLFFNRQVVFSWANIDFMNLPAETILRPVFSLLLQHLWPLPSDPVLELQKVCTRFRVLPLLNRLGQILVEFMTKDESAPCPARQLLGAEEISSTRRDTHPRPELRKFCNALEQVWQDTSRGSGNFRPAGSKPLETYSAVNGAFLKLWETFLPDENPLKDILLELVLRWPVGVFAGQFTSPFVLQLQCVAQYLRPPPPSPFLPDAVTPRVEKGQEEEEYRRAVSRAERVATMILSNRFVMDISDPLLDKEEGEEEVGEEAGEVGEEEKVGEEIGELWNGGGTVRRKKKVLLSNLVATFIAPCGSAYPFICVLCCLFSSGEFPQAIGQPWQKSPPRTELSAFLDWAKAAELSKGVMRFLKLFMGQALQCHTEVFYLPSVEEFCRAYFQASRHGHSEIDGGERVRARIQSSMRFMHLFCRSGAWTQMWQGHKLSLENRLSRYRTMFQTFMDILDGDPFLNWVLPFFLAQQRLTSVAECDVLTGDGANLFGLCKRAAETLLQPPAADSSSSGSGSGSGAMDAAVPHRFWIAAGRNVLDTFVSSQFRLLGGGSNVDRYVDYVIRYFFLRRGGAQKDEEFRSGLPSLPGDLWSYVLTFCHRWEIGNCVRYLYLQHRPLPLSLSS